MASRTDRSTCSFSVRASRLEERVLRNSQRRLRAPRAGRPSRCAAEGGGGGECCSETTTTAATPPPSLALSRSYMRAPLSVISDAVERSAAMSLGRAENVKPSAPCASPSSPAASVSWHVLIRTAARQQRAYNPREVCV